MFESHVWRVQRRCVYLKKMSNTMIDNPKQMRERKQTIAALVFRVALHNSCPTNWEFYNGKSSCNCFQLDVIPKNKRFINMWTVYRQASPSQIYQQSLLWIDYDLLIWKSKQGVPAEIDQHKFRIKSNVSVFSTQRRVLTSSSRLSNRLAPHLWTNNATTSTQNKNKMIDM